NGRAMTTEREDGFIRVVWREADHAVLGLQAVGTGVSELSAAFSLAIEMGACLEDIAGTIHAHPTQSEGLQEACLRALGHALHI
ncbi:MAG: dihydrolipoyl dehydrogenase, partial [Pseudomonadota bacterium]